MAKSLRSKVKVRYRALKREAVFSEPEKKRAERIAERARQNLEKQKLKEAEEAEQNAENTDAVPAAAPEADETMEVDDKKISTSGWKGSRNDGYKKKQAKKRRANLVFRTGKNKSKK